MSLKYEPASAQVAQANTRDAAQAAQNDMLARELQVREREEESVWREGRREDGGFGEMHVQAGSEGRRERQGVGESGSGREGTRDRECGGEEVRECAG